MAKPSDTISNALAVCNACDDAVFQLNVALRLVEDHQCEGASVEADDTGGFELTVIRDLLTRVRDDIRAAGKLIDRTRRADVVNIGGAR